VHPNFFSWSRVRALSWNDSDKAQAQEIAALASNFRNGRQATRIANQLLRSKQRRFGSIDRESNFLVDALGESEGQVALLPDNPSLTQELNARMSR
jgi:hypothetical protein